MKLVTIVGARPEFIKAGPLSLALERHGINEIVVHTGQHYDKNMSEVFFEELGLQPPAYTMVVRPGSHNAQTAGMLEGLDEIVQKEDPDAILVYGDTNSTLAGGLTAAKGRAILVHVEAGLRSFNREMPEEINRIIVDHISDLLMVPTETARENLEREGITEGVFVTGDVQRDAIDFWSQVPSKEIDALDLPETYLGATVHRAGTVDSKVRLMDVIEALNSLTAPVIFPTHPRTRVAMQSYGMAFDHYPNIRFIEPIGFIEMIGLMKSARAILTDSGGIQKEAYLLEVPCITLREETEWVETMEFGWNTVVGTDKQAIIEAESDLKSPTEHPDYYGDGHASDRIAEAILTAWNKE